MIKNIPIEFEPKTYDFKKNFKQSYHYTSNLYEKVLTALVGRLNKLHNVNYPRRYWEIPLNEWLNFFIVNSYSKWVEITKIKNKKNRYYSFDIDQNNIIFMSSLDLSTSYSEETSKYINYKKFIYSEILKKFKIKLKINFINIRNKKKIIRNFSMKEYLINLFFLIKNILSKKKIIFVDKLDIIDKARIILNRDVSFLSINYAEIKKKKLATKQRSSGLNFYCSNNFEKFLSQNIMKVIPRSFLENYEQIQRINLNKVSSNKLVFYLYSDCDYIKFFLSESILKNCKIIIIQHGGSYGYLKYLDEEIREVKLSDYYATYGWNSKKSLTKLSKKIVPFFPMTFKKKKIKNKKQKKILIVLDGMPKEFISFRSIMLMDDYYKVILKKIKIILSSIDKDKLNLIDIRLPRHNQKINKSISQFLESNFKKLNILQPTNSLFRNYDKYKLLVFTGPYTSFQEAIYAGVKFVIFDFENINKFRKSFLSTYNIFKSRKIIISNVKKMIFFLNNYLNVKQNYVINNQQALALKKFSREYLKTYNYDIFVKFTKKNLIKI